MCDEEVNLIEYLNSINVESDDTAEHKAILEETLNEIVCVVDGKGVDEVKVSV